MSFINEIKIGVCKVLMSIHVHFELINSKDLFYDLPSMLDRHVRAERFIPCVGINRWQL